MNKRIQKKKSKSIIGEIALHLDEKRIAKSLNKLRTDEEYFKKINDESIRLAKELEDL